MPRIQVLPMETPVGDTAGAYLALAFTEDLRDALSSTHAVSVLTGSVARAGADYLVRGRVTRRAETVRVDVRLERPATGQVAWTSALTVLPRELPRATATVAAELLDAAGVRARPVVPDAGVDPHLADLLRRGRFQLQRRTEPTVTRAIALYREAIAYDSMSSGAWAGLARSLYYARRRGIPVAGLDADSLLTLELRAAERAVELDPGSPVSWEIRAQVAVDVQPASRTGAIAAVRRALALDPERADAWLLLSQSAEEIGDTAGAREALMRAVALRPDEGEFLSWMALHHIWQGEYDTARRWADSAVAMDPTLPVAHGAAAQAAFRAGRLTDADGHAGALARVTRNSPDFGNGVHVEIRLARGDSVGARAAQHAAVEQAASTPSLHATIAVGIGFLALGDTSRALETLARFPVVADLHYQLHLRREPGLGGLRVHPEFQRLLVALPRTAP